MASHMATSSRAPVWQLAKNVAGSLARAHLISIQILLLAAAAHASRSRLAPTANASDTTTPRAHEATTQLGRSRAGARSSSAPGSDLQYSTNWLRISSRRTGFHAVTSQGQRRLQPHAATPGPRPGWQSLKEKPVMSNIGKSTNVLWHNCPIGQSDRQKFLGQKGCVVWITGLIGSGKSTLACALSRELHYRGHLTYVLDGDNLRHGLNRDLSFKAEDRAENIRRAREVAKLFADAGIICIASLISPYRRDRDACRALLPDSKFIEVFMDFPLKICEARDPKGLYKLARTGKIKGFTGIDDPYEPPVNGEIVIKMIDGECPSTKAMAKQVLCYLEENGYLQA